MSKALVPVQHQVTLPAHLHPTEARAAVHRAVGYRPVQSIVPVTTYPGDANVTMVVTTLEPRRRPAWFWYAIAVAALVIVGALVWAIITNLAMVLVVAAITTICVCGMAESARDRRERLRSGR